MPQYSKYIENTSDKAALIIIISSIFLIVLFFDMRWLIFSISFGLIFLVCGLLQYPKGWLILKSTFALGIAGHTFFFALPEIPIESRNAIFRNIELPVRFGSITIEAPDGHRYAANENLGRIQRYNSDGEFQLGWFVNSAGGVMTIGMTLTGNIAVFAARTNRVEVFSPNGQPIRQLRYYVRAKKVKLFDHPVRPHDIVAQDLQLAEPVKTPNPDLTPTTAALFPLWSILVSFGMLGVGAVPLWLRNRSRRQAQA